MKGELENRLEFEKIWAARDPKWLDWQLAALEKSRHENGYNSDFDSGAWRMWNLMQTNAGNGGI